MKHDGIEATVMYGPAVAVEVADPELRLAVYRAYNDWLVEFCSLRPEAADRGGHAARGGHGGRHGRAAPSRRAWRDEAGEHAHRARDEPDLRSGVGAVLGRDRRERDHRVVPPGAHRAQLLALNDEAHNIFETSKEFINQFLDPLVGLLGRGVLERRPNARLVLAESGLGWPPWVVQEMDYRYARLVSMRDYWEPRGGIGLTMKPSEVFRRQVWVTVQDDQIGLDILHHFGDDKVMWACDYPHPDSTFPESRDGRRTADARPLTSRTQARAARQRGGAL